MAGTGTDGVEAAVSAGDGVAEAAERTKELVVTLFGAERILGTFPTRLHSDVRHVVEMLRRNKQPRLARERLAVLEGAFAAPGSEYRSIAELRSEVEVWRQSGRRAFDADRYYDTARTAGYTEHNRGPQEGLARRTLQFASLATDAPGPAAAARAEPLLAIDLGCGSGLSTVVAARLPGVGVIGVDLSSEMLRSEAWAEVAALPSPLAAERVRCDLSQPLPFRAQAFDVAFSVSAVHFVSEDAERRTSTERLGALLGSLRRCLSPRARPCSFQAFFTQEPRAVSRFREAAEKAGWSLCDLVVDQVHGGGATERDFLYLLAAPPPKAGPARPTRCALYKKTGGTCALGLQAWAWARGVQPVELDAAHHAWLEREHDRFARRLVRLRARCASATAVLDHADPLDTAGQEMARKLEEILSLPSEVCDDAARVERLVDALHSECP